MTKIFKNVFFAFLMVVASNSLVFAQQNSRSSSESYVGSVGAAAPGSATQNGAKSSGLLQPLIQPDSSAPINISTSGTTSIIGSVSGKKIYVTSWDVIAAGVGNIQLEYGTQISTPCDTGTTLLTGAYNLTAQTGISKGSGMGVVFVVPVGNQLCAVTNAAVQMSGSISYTQF